MISYKSAKDLIKILTDEVECETSVNVQFCNDESGLQNEKYDVEKINVQYIGKRGKRCEYGVVAAIIKVGMDFIDFRESNFVPVKLTIFPEPKNEYFRELIEEVLLRVRAANVYITRKGVKGEGVKKC